MTSSNLLGLSKYLKFYKSDLVILIIALIGVALSLLYLGQAFKELIDQGLKVGQMHAINKCILLIISLIIIFGVSSFFRAYIINNIAEKIINDVRLDAFSSLTERPVSYFDDEKVSNIISKLTLDLELISKFIVNFLSFFMRNFLILFGAIIWMFLQSTKLSMIVIVTIPIILIPLLKLAKYVRALSKDAFNSQSEIIANLEESFSFIRTLHAFNQQAYKTLAFKELIAGYLIQTSTRFKIRSLFFAVTISVILASVTLVIWVGSIDIMKGEMTSGQMISFIYYAIVAGVSAGGIAELLSEIQSPLVALERVFGLVDVSRNNNTSQNSLKTENLVEALETDNPANLIIEFQNVGFSYPTRQHTKALSNMSFKIHSKSFIGMVGPSGSGKSTIIQLLLKFYAPTSGVIIVNGQDITDINPQTLRKLFAYVPQDPSIFSGSIKSNIAFSKPNAQEAEIIKVAEITGVIEFANQLPAGLDTEIGEKGIKLSGGQKQRIVLARALLFNPQVLLLDEATSSLDEAGEEKVLSKIKEFMKDRTIISIAHRISSLKDADEIIIIEGGEIIAQGSPDNLLVSDDFCINDLQKN